MLLSLAGVEDSRSHLYIHLLYLGSHFNAHRAEGRSKGPHGR